MNCAEPQVLVHDLLSNFVTLSIKLVCVIHRTSSSARLLTYGLWSPETIPRYLLLDARRGQGRLRFDHGS